MSPPLGLALRWMECIIAVAIIQGTLELFAIRTTCADDGIWRWSTLRRELRWLQPVLAYRAFLGVLLVRLLAASLLLLGVRGATVPILWVATLLVNVRFLGTFNGGSDSMTMVVLSGLVVAHLGAPWPLLVQSALLYVAVQSLMSYFIAGCVKLKNREWRQGTALRSFVASPQFGAPEFVRQHLSSTAMARTASWSVMLFECTVPLALAGPTTALVIIAAASVFHLGNVAVFGLNRFLFAWGATWPAIWYMSGQIN